ncbi:hypothetical protein [Bacillus smithii]
MVLLGLFDYFKRHIYKMDYKQKEKALKEIRSIERLLENSIWSEIR